MLGKCLALWGRKGGFYMPPHEKSRCRNLWGGLSGPRGGGLYPAPLDQIIRPNSPGGFCMTPAKVLSQKTILGPDYPPPVGPENPPPGKSAPFWAGLSAPPRLGNKQYGNYDNFCIRTLFLMFLGSLESAQRVQQEYAKKHHFPTMDLKIK